MEILNPGCGAAVVDHHWLARSGRPAAFRRAVRPVVLGVGLACAALVCGCAHTHTERQATAPVPPPPQPSAPVAGGDGVQTVSVDLNRMPGDDVTFRKTATERQKFQVHIDFGKIFDAQGNLDRAVQEYQDALKVAETRTHRGDLTAADEALAHRRIASALDRQGQFRQSEPHYQRALKLAHRDSRIWNDAGYSYYLQGRWPEAERSLRTALKLAPGDARVRTNLGMTLAAAGKVQEALPLLSANQGDAIGHANLGYLLASTGQYDRAREEYQNALSMRPDLTLARHALSQLDLQERAIAVPSSTTAIARNTSAATAPGSSPVDPQVRLTSATRRKENLPPPTDASKVPPLPPPTPFATLSRPSP
jgi:Tfp pilus assembly protein PilF